MSGRIELRAVPLGLVFALLAVSAVLVSAVIAQDEGRPAIDGSIREADLQHDSRDDLYRAPIGAVPAGSTVHIRVRAAAGDLDGAHLRVTDRLSGESVALPMQLAARDPDGGGFGYDYWEAVVEPGREPTILDYSIVVHDGQASRVLSDDRAGDGGTGRIGREGLPDHPWQITLFDPAFETPAWAPGSVVYQVFPDRFANGDVGNDPSPAATPGPAGAEVYRHADVYGVPIITKRWDELPEGYCRDYKPQTCDEQAFNRDFFGGDLAGLAAELDGLADLGVTVIYLNPIFAAPSNHRYDTSDYFTVDPDLGTAEDFDTLIAEAEASGMRVILDGVFNHVSADSPWFDRFRRYETVGACESADSPYRSWFTFRAPGPGQPEPCAPTQEGGSDSYYVSWWDFDSIPELNEIADVDELFVGPDGVVPTWIERGTAGWRLDVADSMSHHFQAAIRDAAKAADPEAIVIAEQWHDASPWLLGDQADSTMNYRFRRAVLALVNGATPDPDGSLEALSPSGFASAMLGVREDYPPPAYAALLNLVDSHDTARILWTLTPGLDNDVAKSDPAALAQGKAKLRLVSAIQLTFPGMASIYYGDEVGLTGFDDPDDRRPYPWAGEDLELREHYRTLARLRADHEALREGDLEFLHADDATGTLAYLRRSPAAAALLVLNLGDRPRQLAIDVAGRVPDGIELTDALGSLDPVTVDRGVAAVTLEPMSIAILISPADADLVAPQAPAGLEADAGASRIELAWDAVPGATAYQVWRSLVSGGGYQLVAETDDTSHGDALLRDGVPYHYVVTATDQAGNISARSVETMAVPQLTISRLQLLGVSGPDGSPVAALQRVLSAVDGAVAVEVVVATEGATEGIADGVIVEAGLGPPGGDPGGEGWVWSGVDFSAASDDGAIFRGLVQPETLGSQTIAARASTDGGVTWHLAEGRARLTAVPGDDVEPPPAPGAPELIDVSGDRIRLRWPESDVPDMYRYLILRAEAASGAEAATSAGASGGVEASGGAFEIVGSSDVPTFLDASVTAGTPYAYAIQAQDTGFNTSAASEVLEVLAEERAVAVTFTATVPEYTTAGETIYIAGDFQGWNPGATPMTPLGDGRWTITLEFEDGASLQYKYTRGSWEAVEKDAGCGEMANRALTVEYAGSGAQEVADNVEKWRDLDDCG